MFMAPAVPEVDEVDDRADVGVPALGLQRQGTVLGALERGVRGDRHAGRGVVVAAVLHDLLVGAGGVVEDPGRRVTQSHDRAGGPVGPLRVELRAEGGFARFACMFASGQGWIRHHVAASHARTAEIVSESVDPYMIPKLSGVTGHPLLPAASAGTTAPAASRAVAMPTDAIPLSSIPFTRVRVARTPGRGPRMSANGATPGGRLHCILCRVLPDAGFDPRPGARLPPPPPATSRCGRSSRAWSGRRRRSRCGRCCGSTSPSTRPCRATARRRAPGPRGRRGSRPGPCTRRA